MKKPLDTETRFQQAIQQYWSIRDSNQTKQQGKGFSDAGFRGAVTGRTQMHSLTKLVADILAEASLPEMEVSISSGLELPGYFRPEKKWDLVVFSRQRLACVVEFKSQVGPSFGNNANNRAEEAIGNAVDIWTAYRQELLGTGPRPFLGYFFLLEDCDKIHNPVAAKEPHFPVDEVFRQASYAKRYEELCRRLVLERHYEAACLTFATNSKPTRISNPTQDLAFNSFVSALKGVAARFSN